MRHHQRGSVSPVFAMVLMVVILLLGAVLDREWLNFKMHLAEEIADFAAESGARRAEVWDAIVVTRRQVQYSTTESCVDPTIPSPLDPACPGKELVTTSSTVFSDKLVVAEEQALLRDWKAQAECGSDPVEPNWSCESVRIGTRWFVYPSGTVGLMDQVFRQNWQDQPLAHLVSANPIVDAGEGLTKVTVKVEISSVTGLLGWRRNVDITGAAKSRMEPLQLSVR
ncbi:MAG TPA: hypothetical protein VNT01_10095 [Symbiobacteriaceae bacterium]|nr:hypothetical protein [Symbiobacteriaceae bacterium]